MKTIRLFPVNFLRIYASPIERTSAVNGVKSLKVGALVLMESLPDVNGDPTDNNVIELTAKQLDNIASVCRVKGTGRQAWYDLAELTGNSESVASITLIPHRKGDTYVGTDGNEATYTKDGVNTSVDSITFGNDTRKELKAGVINRQVNWVAVENNMKSLLAGLNTTAPNLTIEQNSPTPAVDASVAGK